MEILYHDDRVVVCVKPAGVLSTDEPGGMPALLREALGGDIRGVHRLDRVTGGVMVYARTRRAASDLGAQMRSGRFRKRYLAVVHGAPSPAAGQMTDWLLRDRAARVTRAVPEGTPCAQYAALSYDTRGTAGPLSLVEIELRTGRTHQIRCQLSSRGLPLAGDRKYGGGEDGCALALWSFALAFDHPRTGERMAFTRPPDRLPPWDLFHTSKRTLYSLEKAAIPRLCAR